MSFRQTVEARILQFPKDRTRSTQEPADSYLYGHETYGHQIYCPDCMKDLQLTEEGIHPAFEPHPGFAGSDCEIDENGVCVSEFHGAKPHWAMVGTRCAGCGSVFR